MLPVLSSGLPHRARGRDRSRAFPLPIWPISSTALNATAIACEGPPDFALFDGATPLLNDSVRFLREVAAVGTLSA